MRKGSDTEAFFFCAPYCMKFRDFHLERHNALLYLRFQCRHVCSALANNILFSSVLCALKVRAMSPHEEACPISRRRISSSHQCVDSGTQGGFNVRHAMFLPTAETPCATLSSHCYPTTSIQVSDCVINAVTCTLTSQGFSFVGEAFS